MGSGGIAFLEGSPCLQQDKLHSDKNATKQTFPKERDFRILGTDTNMTDKPSPGTHFKVNHETDYTTHKAFPWHSSQSIQGDRLHQDEQNLPLESF